MTNGFNGFNNVLKQFSKKTDLTKTESVKNKVQKINEAELEDALFEQKDEVVQPKSKEKKSCHGHRARARERFLISDATKFSEVDILELALFSLVPRADVKEIARNMIAKFGNIKNIASKESLELGGFGINPESLFFFFKLVKELNARIMRQTMDKKVIFSEWSTMLSYVQTLIGNETNENFKVVFLNTKYKLIEDANFGTGTIDEVTIYTREVVKKAIELKARYVILAHNHPSGSLEPSGQDIALTDKLQQAMRNIGVELMDHFIVNGKNHFSFKENMLIDD